MADTVIKRRRKRGARGVLIPLAAGLLAILILAAAAVKRTDSYLALAASERVREVAERALNLAAAETLAGLEEGFLSVTKLDDEAFIINADTVSLGRFITETVARADEALASLGRIGASIETGTVTGLVPLTGEGRPITVRFKPIGAVHAQSAASLRSAGINQSLFTVSVILTVRIRVILAGRDELIEIKNTVPIAETVIAGRVPQVYTNVANEDDMLNLIPTNVP
ncbi:MAG: sporulation protein YunB [Clostridia bacterium]|nr:sporulation protein YunB [Clostridia bacterium]